MIRNKLAQLLLTPFSLLYGMGVSLHHFFYRTGVLKAVKFDIPTIAVGNLSVGGAGKTPHIEYLIRLLKDHIHVSTLSRGYKRKTKGFYLIKPNMNAEQAGDEPLQFKRKFPDITVAVSESRTLAIPEMLAYHPEIQTVLLDDAYQHLAINPGLNILLTEYNAPFSKDYLLPSGRLREWRSGYERADIIIVSKCPNAIGDSEKENMVNEINPLPNQQLFFSYYQYGYPYYILNPKQRIQLDQNLDILLVCAIAKTDYLMEYLEGTANFVHTMVYEDHHYFSATDLSNIKKTFDQLEAPRKLIITTEKDAMRLEIHRPFLIKHQIPIFVLPAEVKFHYNGSQEFDQLIKDFLLNFKI